MSFNVNILYRNSIKSPKKRLYPLKVLVSQSLVMNNSELLNLYIRREGKTMYHTRKVN